MTYSELRNNAEKYRKAKDFSSAGKYYEQIWNNYFNEATGWDGWGYAVCLNKAKEYKKAVEVCSAALKKSPELVYLRSQYSWALYCAEIKDIETVSGKLELGKAEEKALKVLELGGFNSNELAIQKTAFKIIELAEEQNEWNVIVKWSLYLNPQFLSKDGFKVQKSGKQIMLPSDHEKWYSKITKAYEKLGKVEECLSKVEEGLSFYPNDIWLKRRKCLMLAKKNQHEIALSGLIELSGKKHDWFILMDIAQIYEMAGNDEKALNYYIDACLESRKIDSRQNLWELFFLTAKQLENKDSDMAKRHYELAASLRKENSWSIGNGLLSALNNNNLKIESLPNSAEIYSELLKYWMEHKKSAMTQLSGTIKKILPNGKSGFISSSDSKEYYFRFSSFTGNRKDIKENLQVSFSVKKSFDVIKNRESFEAVFIEKIKS